MGTMLITSIFIILSHINLGLCGTPDCSNAFPGQLVSDPDNCHNYYICPDGEGNSHSCPDDGCFNPVGYCADATSSYCLSHCQYTDITTASTTNSSPSTTSSTSTPTSVLPTETTPTSATDVTTPSSSPVKCGNSVPGTMVPDPINCRKYFICTDNGAWLIQSCPGDSCFLGALNTCYDNTDYCTDFCGDDTTTAPITTSTMYTTTISTPKSTATSTDTPITTSMTSTDTPDDCYDVNYFECPRKGYYAKCNYCTPEYFYCHGYGSWAHEEVCAWPLVFNPDPSYPYCVPPYNCPYHPDTITTTTPEPISGCIDMDDFYCPGHGYYAKCDYCVPEYYYCYHHGEHPTQGQCSGHMMFNPDPHYPYCVDPYDCPHHH